MRFGFNILFSLALLNADSFLFVSFFLLARYKMRTKLDSLLILWDFEVSALSRDELFKILHLKIARDVAGEEKRDDVGELNEAQSIINACCFPPQ